MNVDKSDVYRVTIRYQRQVQKYEILEVEAENLRDAMLRAVERFPTELTETSDLVEVRLAHPPD